MLKSCLLCFYGILRAHKWAFALADYEGFFHKIPLLYNELTLEVDLFFKASGNSLLSTTSKPAVALNGVAKELD